MTIEARFRRIRELFERALEEQPDDVQGWLEREAGDDRDVKAEVYSLLRHHTQAGTFLLEPAVERAPHLLLEEMPDAIGPYAVVREIGRGGMGRVYLAIDGRLGRRVALKALSPELTADPSHRDRLRREARAAAALCHPGICTIYALEEFDGHLFIAAEFVEGRTLRDEIDAGEDRSASGLLATARELAGALASAHRKGIVHRDLKPENVMRAADGRLKILDFGLARFDRPAADVSLGPVTRPGTILGTPAYMAPEQLNGLPADARADVFAFGVLMYELACGSHPFAASTPLAVVARILESEPDPIAGRGGEIPRPLGAVVDRCLRKAPADRFETAAEILTALERTDPPARPARPVSWWRVHQMTVIALYALACAVGWLVKEWQPGTAAALFVGLSIAATIGAVFRGHLMFTERVNAAGLAAERGRAGPVTLAIDGFVGLALLADGALLAPDRLVAAVLTMALGVGIALARLLLEPSTTAAAFRRGQPSSL
jgi:hypothetical protein